MRELQQVPNEPGPDWVPLHLAPYCCSSEQFDPSLVTSRSALVELVRKFTPLLKIEKFRDVAWLLGANQHVDDEYLAPLSWNVFENGEMVVVEGGRLTTQIVRGQISIYFSDELRTLPEPESVIWCSGCDDFAEILDPDLWDREFSLASRACAEWHRQLLKKIVDHWMGVFCNEISSSRAHIVARKNGILAPFESISWDQWQHFDLDAQGRKIHPLFGKPFGMDEVPPTATSPTGDRLFSIYVKPGIRKPETSETQCQRWLEKLLRECARRPKALESLRLEAQRRFPGLSQRGFRRCLLLAQAQTGNSNWSLPGAPTLANRQSLHCVT